MTRQIKRRDFLNGMVYGAVAGAFSPSLLLALGESSELPSGLPPGHYPPTLTGMRGSHPGSFEVAHALAWRGEKPDQYKALDEHFDLVVVGAGLSGLAAARFYQKKMGPDVRILILDNHDDFGGHAKRNEFHHDGRMVLSLGGAQILVDVGSYSDTARGLMDELGIDTEAMKASMQQAHAQSDLSAANGISLPGPDGRVTVNCNWMTVMHGKGDFVAVVRALPLPTAEQDKLIALFGGDVDYLDELSLREKYSYAKTTSYNRFLVDRVGLDMATVPLLNTLLRHYSGFSGWNFSVLEAIQGGAPGLQGMGWLGELADSLLFSLAEYLVDIQQFADGNASVARLLVHKLIPGVAPDTSGFRDIATSRFDYSALDRKHQPVRMRLNSTVVGAKQIDDTQVQVDYVQEGKALRTHAKHCVLACYNGIIPHLCPELPEKQKEALRYGVKVPFVYANVLLDNGRAFSKLGMTMVHCPNDPFTMLASAPPNAAGGYQPPRGPEDPMAILMMSSPTPDALRGESARDLFRVGRSIIYSTTFETYEQRIRDQLQGLLGGHGFNHETDIRAITVNRIAHGYSYSYLALDDPEWPEGQAPHEIGRAQFGRISIANSDSNAQPLMDSAFDAAWRAVLEQTS